MHLSRDLHEGYLYFRSCAADHVTVVDRAVTRSFLLAPDRLVEDWPPSAPEHIDANAIASVVALEPEVVLLGTGTSQVFPPAATRAAFLARGIGLEVMDNAAACRTYNLLAGEGRRVIAAILLPAAAIE